LKYAKILKILFWRSLMKKIISMIAISAISLSSLTACPAPAGVTAANDLVKQIECAVGKSGISGEQKIQFDAALSAIKSAIQASQAAGSAGDTALKAAVDAVPQSLKDAMKALGC
jgi:hypothetical protein